MSLDATRWAWKQDVKPEAKLLLLSLADQVGDDRAVNPFNDMTFRDTGFDSDGLVIWLSYLQRKNLLHVVHGDDGVEPFVQLVMQ